MQRISQAGHSSLYTLYMSVLAFIVFFSASASPLIDRFFVITDSPVSETKAFLTKKEFGFVTSEHPRTTHLKTSRYKSLPGVGDNSVYPDGFMGKEKLPPGLSAGNAISISRTVFIKEQRHTLLSSRAPPLTAA